MKIIIGLIFLIFLNGIHSYYPDKTASPFHGWYTRFTIDSVNSVDSVDSQNSFAIIIAFNSLNQTNLITVIHNIGDDFQIKSYFPKENFNIEILENGFVVRNSMIKFSVGLNQTEIDLQTDDYDIRAKINNHPIPFYYNLIDKVASKLTDINWIVHDLDGHGQFNFSYDNLIKISGSASVHQEYNSENFHLVGTGFRDRPYHKIQPTYLLLLLLENFMVSPFGKA